ncbi:hypothetical protein IFT64_02280 [Oxalobacteraceae sp. CFBP 8753]|nr:hypothetical protein [Oxalobacteraceae sp. CFBP 8753]
MRHVLIFLTGMLSTLPLMAQDELKVSANQSHILPAGVSALSYKRLILEQNASLFIPEQTRELTLRADYFVAESGARILQYAAQRARTGAQGSRGAQPGTGEQGGIGGEGSAGAAGRDSVDLTLQLGIARIDKTTIMLVSQAGGNGGKGGTGGFGGSSACTSPRTNGGAGGTGGRGGVGGAPGAVGPIRVSWWPVGDTIPYFSSGQPVGLSVVLQAGESGWGGMGGDGGTGAEGKSCFLLDGVGNGPGGSGGAQGAPWTKKPQYREVEFGRLEVAP